MSMYLRVLLGQIRLLLISPADGGILRESSRGIRSKREQARSKLIEINSLCDMQRPFMVKVQNVRYNADEPSIPIL